MEKSIFKGSLTELQCIASFVELGYEVSVPFGNHAKYDFIADINGNLIKVQVKTAKVNEDFLVFECRNFIPKKNHNVRNLYNKIDVDYFSTFANNKCYLVPIEECSARKKIYFNGELCKKNGNLNFEKRYELKEVIKSLDIVE